MDHDSLRLLYQQVDFNSELEIVAWVAVLVGFNLILKISNLGPDVRKNFSARKNFVRSDLTIRREIPTILVRWAKNIQHRNKTMWCPLVPSNDSRICPQFWVKQMFRAIPADAEEPMSLVREGKLRFPLTSVQVNRLLKKWMDKVELPANFTGHCLHRGGV